jgi:hypothetical protein
MDCENCGRIFSDKRAKKYHIDHGVCKKNNPEPVKPKLKLKLISRSTFAQMSHDQLVDQIIHLQGKYDSLKENPQNVNNIIIFPNPFGKEDIGCIQQKLGDIVGPLIIGHTFDSIPFLFKKIHNNKIMPEYHNVYSSSERSNYVMISDGKTFTHCPKKTIIDQIIEDKRSILNNYIDSNGEQLGEKVLKKYERYQDRIDEDPEFRKNLEVEIGGLLLDMKSVIASDDKTRKLLEKVNDGEFDL